MGAHPRACGENSPRARGQRRGGGSSPRVRGKLWSVRRAGGEPRLIPARAGKTMLRRKSPVYIAAHPRACGENPRARHLPGDCYGSSPRVRGKQQWVGRDEGVAVAHPRACGENVRRGTSRAAVSGSSPRVRGKLERVHARFQRGRLIPARAGKTRRGLGCRPDAQAHPRACGENWTNAGKELPFEGSSPRVRGKRTSRPSAPEPKGLIPARAGKTVASRSSLAVGRAHPRACGENIEPKTMPNPALGSSPRVRGKRPHGVVHAARERLIPARAGKTSVSVESQT